SLSRSERRRSSTQQATRFILVVSEASVADRHSTNRLTRQDKREPRLQPTGLRRLLASIPEIRRGARPISSLNRRAGLLISLLVNRRLPGKSSRVAGWNECRRTDHKRRLPRGCLPRGRDFEREPYGTVIGE